MELLHVTTKEKWVLKTQIFKTFTSFEALPPWNSKCQAVKHTKCTLHFSQSINRLNSQQGEGGISSSKEKTGPKGKIKPKKGGKFPSRRKMGPKGKGKCVQKMRICHI